MKKLFLFSLGMLFSAQFFAQNVGIGTNTPDASAILHINTDSGTTKGLLVTGFHDFTNGTIPDLGEGARMMFFPGKAAFRAGYTSGNRWDNANVGLYSTAMGNGTTASGTISTAMGINTTASGFSSTAMGDGTIASGWFSTAMGINTTASRFYSTAMGAFTTASGDYSTAMGSNTIASGWVSTATGAATISKGYASTVIGMFNDSILTTNQVEATSSTPLFIIGNGNGDIERSNAMVVRKNGAVGIGTNTPTGRMQIAHNSNTASPTLTLFETNANNYARLQFQNASGNKYWHVAGLIDNTTDAFSKLNFFHSVTGNIMSLAGNGNVGIGTSSPSQRLHVAGNICATGTIGACSDIRYKTQILPMSNVLPSLLSLQPIYYSWKKEFIDKGFADERHIGFSAQEVERLYPEVVQTQADGYKAVDYSRLTPVLVQAIKEQQKQIEEAAYKMKVQEAKIEQQQKDIDLLKQQVKQFLK